MKKKRIWITMLLLTTILATGVIGFIKITLKEAHAATSITGLHIVGNQVVNGAGQVFQPHGVDRSGTEYMCDNSQSTTVFDGPSDATSVAAIASWGVNTVRVPLNEDCWLGINGYPAAQYSSATYQQSIINFVNLLNANNIAVILDLHWTAPGNQQSQSQTAMPDANHTGAFWTSVANIFKNNSSVIFDLFNEPFTQSWSCWLNGSSAANQAPCGDVNFAVAGMQSMVNTVRATGATNILMAGGLAYSNNLSQWLQNKPNDPLHNLAASWHLYNFNACNSSSCWNSQVAPVAAQVPVITGEIGENDCSTGFINSAMSWNDQHGIGYLGWAWDTYNCNTFPALITNYDGTPTAFGLGIKNHLLALANNPTPILTSTPTPAPTPNPSTIAINAGGSSAGNFSADTGYSGGHTFFNIFSNVDTSAVSNPAPQAVYQSERYGNFNYTIPNLTANAAYIVRLHFAEIYWSAKGQRIFNVSINGYQVLSNFDIVAAAGGPDKAIVEQFSATADESGTISIQFSTVVDNAKVSGIEVIPS